MIKSKETSDPNSCLNKASPKEPVFVLRAHDPGMPDAVRAWANLYLIRKRGFKNMTSRELHKYNDALACAQDAENWRRLNAR